MEAPTHPPTTNTSSPSDSKAPASDDLGELQRSIDERREEMPINTPRRLMASKKMLDAISEASAGLTDAEVAAREVKAEEAARANRVQLFAQQAGGRKIAGYRFGNWEATTKAQEAVKAAVQDWAQTFPERRDKCEGLVLYGACGTGKDHLAFAAVRQAIITHGATAIWQNGRDLMGEVRDRIEEGKPERELIRRLEICDVLVISDPLPPMGELREFQADILYRIAENRSADARLTVMTLNVASDEEADRRLGVPTWDRLCDRAWKIHCAWASHRKPAREIGGGK